MGSTHEMARVAEGMRFPEANRWRDGALWFVDMHGGDVLRLPGGAGVPQLVAHVDDHLSGMGWLPDGTLLVTSMRARQVLAVGEDGTTTVHADLSAITGFEINDMLVDSDGRAYVGGFGYDANGGGELAPGPLIRVDPDGTATQIDELMFPNGMVILPGTRTLVVNETYGARLSAYELTPEGDVTGKRVWSEGVEVVPDGGTLDSEGGVWVANLMAGQFLRLVDGALVETIQLEAGRLAIDCALGGYDGRTLFMSTATTWDPALTDAREGQILATRVTVPG